MEEINRIFAGARIHYASPSNNFVIAGSKEWSTLTSYIRAIKSNKYTLVRIECNDKIKERIKNL